MTDRPESTRPKAAGGAAVAVRVALVVLACVLVVCASIVGVLQSWDASELGRVYIGAAVVALAAADVKWPPGGAGGTGATLAFLVRPLLAFGASELGADIIAGGS